MYNINIYNSNLYNGDLLTISLSESITSSDSLSIVWTIVRALLENITTSDVISHTTAFTRLLAESIFTDSLEGVKLRDVVYNETIKLADWLTVTRIDDPFGD